MTDFVGIAAIIAALGTAVAGVVAQFKIRKSVQAASEVSIKGQGAIAKQLTAQDSKLADIHESTNGSLTAANAGLDAARKEIADLRVHVEQLLAEQQANRKARGGL